MTDESADDVGGIDSWGIFCRGVHAHVHSHCAGWQAALRRFASPSRTHRKAAPLAMAVVLDGGVRPGDTDAEGRAVGSRGHGGIDVRAVSRDADPGRGQGGSPWMKDLWEVGEFVRRIRARMRFGELSRAPVRLVR